MGSGEKDMKNTSFSRYSRFFSTSMNTMFSASRMSWKGFTSSLQFSMDTPSPKPTALTFLSRNHSAVSAFTNSRLSFSVLVSGVKGFSL